MSGILGSYLTNNYNISVQPASRFVDNNVFSPSNRLNEFFQEHYPTLHYKKDSLMQKTVETEFIKNIGSVEITSLPPIKELSFTQSEIDDLKLKNQMQIFCFCIKVF